MVLKRFWVMQLINVAGTLPVTVTAGTLGVERSTNRLPLIIVATSLRGDDQRPARCRRDLLMYCW
jgi:hypothetical protein